MKVWIVERNCYEDNHIVGIYISRELAIELNPVMREATSSHFERSGGWQVMDDSMLHWWNGLDGYDCCMLDCLEVQGVET